MKNLRNMIPLSLSGFFMFLLFAGVECNPDDEETVNPPDDDKCG
jgi:hypothetical protein